MDFGLILETYMETILWMLVMTEEETNLCNSSDANWGPLSLCLHVCTPSLLSPIDTPRHIPLTLNVNSLYINGDDDMCLVVCLSHFSNKSSKKLYRAKRG